MTFTCNKFLGYFNLEAANLIFCSLKWPSQLVNDADDDVTSSRLSTKCILLICRVFLARRDPSRHRFVGYEPARRPATALAHFVVGDNASCRRFRSRPTDGAVASLQQAVSSAGSDNRRGGGNGCGCLRANGRVPHQPRLSVRWRTRGNTPAASRF